MTTCRTVTLVAVRPMTATLSDLTTFGASQEQREHEAHARFMSNKARRWCSLPPGHDGEHDFTREAPID